MATELVSSGVNSRISPVGVVKSEDIFRVVVGVRAKTVNDSFVE
jgi:hypothetical protein